MKVSIGYNDIEGPWGGGINFFRQLKNFLEKKNIDVVSNLIEDDIDIILLTEPRRFTESSSFSHIDIKNYIDKVNRNTLVVNRINECDERKDTRGLNKFLMNSSLVSDHTVFISNWLKDLFLDQGFSNMNYSVIHNGADEEIFYPINKLEKTAEKFKIVTHHWGANANKGIAAYKTLDLLLENHNFKSEFEFTFIGNLPKNIILKNTKVLKPMNNLEIASYLRNCHIYLTGSINEPAGMHHIEGALSGLPILYIESGGITEYCKNYGIQYTVDNLEEKLAEIKNKYKEYKKSLLNYEFTGNTMNQKYLDLFNNLIDDRSNLLNSRKQRQTFRLKNQYKIINKYFYL